LLTEIGINKNKFVLNTHTVTIILKIWCLYEHLGRLVICSRYDIWVEIVKLMNLLKSIGLNCKEPSTRIKLRLREPLWYPDKNLCEPWDPDTSHKTLAYDILP